MKGLIETLLSADAKTNVFASPGGWITYGDVRAMAARAATPMGEGDAPVFLHTFSAARFAAGLLAAASLRRRIVLPAHSQSAYLAELGCVDVFDDTRFEQSATEARLGAPTDDPTLVFFTSGSTGAPMPVEKQLSHLEIEGRALDALWGSEAGHVRATVSHQHIYGLLFRISWPILSGRTGDEFAATYWEDLAGKLGADTTLISSPAHLTRLPPRADFFAEAPPLVFSSGQLLPAADAAICARAFGRPVIEVFGSTETGGVAWRRQEDATTPWTPFTNVNASAGEDGALEVRSLYLPQGAVHRTGDGAELLSDGRFRLKPRQDRVVKVDGKRVSLSRVEGVLAAMPQIESAAALALPERKDALAAIAVLTDEGKAQLAALGAFRLSRALRSALADTLEPAERPKHWRFVGAIPADSQGKRVLSTLRALFAEFDPLDALAIDLRVHTEREAEIVFALAPDLIFFDGHFLGRPILPGVAQAHLAVLMARKIWGAEPSDANLARLKFRRVLVPGDEVVLKLRHDPAIGRIVFSFQLGDEPVSQGEIGGFTR